MKFCFAHDNEYKEVADLNECPVLCQCTVGISVDWKLYTYMYIKSQELVTTSDKILRNVENRVDTLQTP